MASGPDRHRVVPTGGRQQERRARCPSQPSPGTCAQRRSPSSSRCPQRRSAAGPRRACCPTSAPWAATDATPTPRSGPCWKPCPSHPWPASRASRLTAPTSLLSVASVAVRDRPPLDRGRGGPGHARVLPCERQSGSSADLGERSETDADLHGRLTVVHRCCPWFSGGARPQRGPVGSGHTQPQPHTTAGKDHWVTG